MPNILHRIGTNKATEKQLFNAVATTEGLANWWTTKVSGKSEIGGVLKFRFGKGGPDFKIIDLQPLKKVEWKCVQGPKDWLDTHIEFNILKEKGEKVLLFRHGGWREESEFMNHCSTQWAYFLIGLRKYLETGKGTPFGGDFDEISNWSK
jgi:hypothetical protein